MPTTWAPAVSGSPATAAQFNALLVAHPAHLAYTGTAVSSETGAETATRSSYGAWTAQPFTMSGTAVDRVALTARAVGAGADVTVSLRADNSGSPSSSSITSLVLPKEFLGASARSVSVPLAATGLTNAATYWLVVASGGDVANYTLLSADAATPAAKTSTDGAVWSASAVRLLHAVAAGATGPLLAAFEDSGARWAELVRNGSGVLTGVNEIVGSLRGARTMQYDANGVLTGVS